VELEFRQYICWQKTRIPGLSYGVVYVILRLAVLVQCWLVTDRRTDRRAHDDSIASRGKKSQRSASSEQFYEVCMANKIVSWTVEF